MPVGMKAWRGRVKKEVLISKVVAASFSSFSPPTCRKSRSLLLPAFSRKVHWEKGKQIESFWDSSDFFFFPK